MYVETMNQGTQTGLYSFLSIHVWWKNGEDVVKHTWSVLSEDAKEDAYHAWAFLTHVLSEVTSLLSLKLFPSPP
jgi:hypothetical protein